MKAKTEEGVVNGEENATFYEFSKNPWNEML